MSFVEWFKSKPYWLKGGIIIPFISFIFILMAKASTVLSPDNLFIEGVFAIPLLLISFPLVLLVIQLGIMIGNSYEFMFGQSIIWSVITIIIAIAYYFLIGALIGWIIGKIKSRNN